MNSDTSFNWVLGVFGGTLVVAGLVIGTSPERRPVSEGGSGTLESMPASLDDVLDLSGKVTGNLTTDPNPTPVTGNWTFGNLSFQEHENITISAESFKTITIPGHHVITQAEAEEVMKVMDSGAAVWQMLAEFAAERGNADLAKQCRAHEAYYGTALATWRKRVEEGKP